MTLRLNGSTSGYTEIDAPAVAGNNTLVLPSGNGTSGQVLTTNGSGALSWVDRGRMVLATAQNTTSGTAIDFTGIPSWVKRVTVMFNGVSTSGTSIPIVQIGASSGIENTGYAAGAAHGITANAFFNTGAGLPIGSANNSGASSLRYGSIVLTLISGNTWVTQGVVHESTAFGVGCFIAGAKSLSGTLDRVRITTVNGTDTFDAGSINILYEG
jgi:hypothetical protein